MTNVNKCDNCGEFMEIGYYVEAGASELYYCSDECLYANYEKADYNEMYEAGEAYFTEWHYEAIGVWGITNNTAVEALEVDSDYTIIREPNGTISEHEVQYASFEEGDEDAEFHEDGAAYIQLGELRLYFDECMRVGGDR